MPRKRRAENPWALDPLDLPSDRALERVPALRGLESNAAFRMMAFRKRTMTAGVVAECVIGTLVLDDVLELHAAGFPAEEFARALWGASASRRTLRAVGLFATWLAVAGVFCLAGSLFTLGQEIGNAMFWIGVIAPPVAALIFVTLRHEPYTFSSTSLTSIAAFAGRVTALEAARKRRSGEAGATALSTLRQALMVIAGIAVLLLVLAGFVGAVWAVIFLVYSVLRGMGVLWRGGIGLPLLAFSLWLIAAWVWRLQERAARSGAMAEAAEKRLAEHAKSLADAFALLNGDGIIEGLRGKKL